MNPTEGITRSPNSTHLYWRALRLIALLGCFTSGLSALGATYFINSARGDDHRAGTSPEQAWRSLEPVRRAGLQPGDRLLFARGVRQMGGVELENLGGSAEAPIVISSYAAGPGEPAGPAVIDGRDCQAALHLRNCRHVRVEDLTLTADGGRPVGQMRCGVLVEAAGAGDYGDVCLTGLRVKAVSFEEPGYVRPAADVRTANGEGHYGWGIRFIVRGDACVLSGIVVRDCVIERVDHTGLKFNGRAHLIRNVRVEDVRVTDVGGPGIQLSGVQDGILRRLEVDHSGSVGDTRNWGRGSGLWTWNCSGVVIEHSRFTHANGPGDSTGVHIDFNCRDVVVQYNYSAHNAGGFCEVLGNTHNCAYRYNVSVDDGFREKGRDGAFQEGKIFWLSGYVGAGHPPKGPFDFYFYNNTVYVGPGITAKFAVASTADGVLVANNIFCVAGPSRRVAGDQLRSERSVPPLIPRAVMEHNLFLRPGIWPEGLGLEDPSPLIGDPHFASPGGTRLQDYIPGDPAVVRDRGVVISPLPGDSVGLKAGLRVNSDILGRAVTGAPDLGAIEVQ